MWRSSGPPRALPSSHADAARCLRYAWALANAAGDLRHAGADSRRSRDAGTDAHAHADAQADPVAYRAANAEADSQADPNARAGIRQAHRARVGEGRQKPG